MTESNYACGFCATHFKYKNHYDEHVACCEFIYARAKERNAVVDPVDDTIPNSRMMYEIVKHLVFKNQQLENEMKELRKFARRERNKINIIDYLNKNQTPHVDYETFLKSLVASTKHLKVVFSGNIIDGVCSLILDSILEHTIRHFPIAAFSHKSNVFYVFSNETWRELSHDRVNSLFEMTSNLFMGAYKRWEKTQLTEKTQLGGQLTDGLTDRVQMPDMVQMPEENEDIQKQKMIFMKKVLGTYIGDEYKYRKFSGWLFDHLKQNVRNIVEYEFC